jgi:hypothetical protein
MIISIGREKYGSKPDFKDRSDSQVVIVWFNQILFTNQMRKTVLITFLFLQLICRAEYDNTYVLSVTQKFAIPEEVENGDDVGTWRKTYTWVPVGVVSYSIEQNYNSAFSIDSSSGLITIGDASKINGQVFQPDMVVNLIIRTTDSAEGFELDTARIWIKEHSYCKFIDYGYSGTENGSRTQPYNDLDDVEKIPGYGYFIKRGVRFNQETTILKAHIATAGALMASALISLSQYVEKSLSEKYLEVAEKQIRTLASPEYTAGIGENGNFILRHSVGSLPHKSEVDTPLTYADYYYLEALLKYKKLVLSDKISSLN